MIYNFDQLPPEVAKLANEFLNIEIEGKTFPSPYFINKGKKLAHPSLSGKGTPDQIKDLVKSTAHAYNFDLTTASVEEIRQFMLKNEIGIDCSGLVAQLLNAWLKDKTGKSLIDHLKKPTNLYKRLTFKLRPWSNISADKLTDQNNTEIVEIKDVRAGDLIRSKGAIKGDHILMVTKVNKEGNKVKSFEYIQSISKYGNDNGVRLGTVEIVDENKPLHEQKWSDVDSNGKNPTLDGIKARAEDNGLRRFKGLK